MSSSLRERTRQRRRHAIQLAGMKLFAEHGYEATTVADIAHLAEVSTRTVSMYFPTKREIALASIDEGVHRLAARLQALPPGQGVANALLAWLKEEPQHVDPTEWRLRRAMMIANPQLAASGTPATEGLAQIAATALGQELDLEPTHPAILLVCGAIAGLWQQYDLLAATPEGDLSNLGTVSAILHGLITSTREGAARAGDLPTVVSAVGTADG